MNQSRNQYIIYTVLVVLAVLLTVVLLNNNREPETKFGRAMEELGEGVEDAGRELDPHRTTGEKVGDAIDDLGDDIQDATDSK